MTSLARIVAGPDDAPTLVLLHGITGSAVSLAEAIDHWVGRGYRVVAVDARGHGLSPRWEPAELERAGEVLVEDLIAVLEDLATGSRGRAALGLSTPPAPVVIGHSMGAALAYQTAACLQEIHRTPPEAVVIAARQAPGETIEGEYRSSMGLDALREELEAVGGTPPEILADDDIMNLLLTGIQRDYVLHEDFRHASTVLSCPILAFAGEQDPTVTPGMLSRWSRFTSGRFAMKVLPGGHFFPLDADAGFLGELADGIEEITREIV